MKFSKQFLQSLFGWESHPDANEARIISQDLVDSSGWSLHYEAVFSYKGHFYKTHFSAGATESQDESPYEYSEDEVECKEVVPVEELVVIYREIK